MWQLLKASHFVRGAGAAIALLTLLPQLLPYHVLDLVAGIHAAITGWNVITGWIGRTLASLFNIPAIPAELINAVVLALSIAPAWSLVIFRSEWGQHKGAVRNTAFATRGILAFFEVFIWAFMVTALKPGVMLFLALLPLILVLTTAIRNLPPYRAGLVMMLGFLVLVEGVYVFSSPAVQAAFDGFVCAQEGSIAPRCQGDDAA